MMRKQNNSCRKVKAESPVNFRAFLLVNGRLPGVSGKFTEDSEQRLLPFDGGHVEAVADGSHGAAEVTAEFADTLFAVPFGDVCLLGIGLDADVDVLPAKVFLHGFCYMVTIFGRKEVEQFVVVRHFPVFCEGVISSSYKFRCIPATMMSVISALSSSCTPHTGLAGKRALVRPASNWWYLR
jgi:hypothetical protein